MRSNYTGKIGYTYRRPARSREESSLRYARELKKAFDETELAAELKASSHSELSSAAIRGELIWHRSTRL
jgi:hypothetical protein